MKKGIQIVLCLLLMGMLLLYPAIEVNAEEITTSTEDITAPKLVSISLSQAKIETPGSLEVIIEATDEVSGIDYFDASFQNVETGKSLSVRGSTTYRDEFYKEQKYEDGKLHGVLETDQYTGAGTYVIAYINIADKAGNSIYWEGEGDSQYSYYETYLPERLLPISMRNISLEVINTGKMPNVVTSTANPIFIEQVNSVEDDGNIVADFSSNSKVSSDIFSAIEGTNKEVTFTSEGISWQFSGADIKSENVKDINLSVSMQKVDEEAGEVASEIKEKVGDTPSVILHFADNGTLPGKATIRVKADYAMISYLGTSGLEVFWFDTENNELVPIASNVTLDANNNIVFDITHCSYYVIKGKTIKPNSEIPASGITVDSLLNAAIAENAELVEWNEGDTLSISTMRILKNNPKLTLKFSYSYEGKDYVVYISGKDVIVDENIPWYGPLYLASKYPSDMKKEEQKYVIQKGDTLNKIAAKLGVTVEDLLQKNVYIKNRNIIFAGQALLY